ncbi:uncharacterized protein MYCFIDRAFT_213887 [Pseudocercospora fijiensis CIRAD86]|uniref:Ubiquitin-like domain-containing protein n=1 Tax=Pseudocercospora fijiensis (strain CIRAD86) TaxID=383855 RepID=M2Z6U5_PSEFD|nr:uncharacterized protein MYCFIDRAFT_213887 [Pseudocercospora fijiensis CIRAD86]EME85505.1 hypothetical protein MYCFIDRAFT_213887 [Pseudocercospora fijiensis CIRAD86]
MAPPPAEPPKAITLNIKVPPGHLADGIDDFSLGDEVPVSQTIGQIRQRLSQSLPSTPAPERLRILYGGRALVDDEQTLADALNVRRAPEQVKYYVHLLVKGEGAANAPIPHASSQRRGVGTPVRSASPAQAQQAQSQAAPPQQQQQPAQNILHGVHPQHAQVHQAALFAQQQQMQAHLQHQALTLAQQQHALRMRQQQMTQAQQAQHVPGQNGPPQADAAAEGGHNHRATSLTSHPQPPRSISQPPSHPVNQGMHIEGYGPNGERVVIHQQSFAFNPTQLGNHALPNLHHAPMGLPSLPGMPPQTQARGNGPSALDQARNHIVEMRRMLDEIRGQADTDEGRNRIEQLDRRTQSLNDYIDPLHLGSSARNRAAQPNPALGTLPNATGAQIARSTSQPPLGHQQTWQQRAQGILQSQQHVSPSSQPTDVTAYLLSSPTGPQAILFSPQHGTFAGARLRLGRSLQVGLQPSPTTQSSDTPTAANMQAQQNQPAAQGQPAAAQPAQGAQAQMAPAQPDPLGPMAPFINHMWLLLRILIFAYFLLGANLGWRRPLALIAIGLGFWFMRQGLLGDGAAVRRWWDGVVNDGRPRPAQPQQNIQGQPPAQPQQPGQPAAADGRAGQMPTPEQLAQRLLDEDRRQRNERLQWLRDYLRPVERTIALLVASLFPGIGEAYVRGREEEERRRNEEEMAARRREDEERQRREEEEKKNADGNSAGSADKEVPPTDEAVAPAAADAQDAQEGTDAAETAIRQSFVNQ